MLWVQWVLRILDFFAVSMVIPTMAQFFTSAGGSSADYYNALVATSGVQLVANIVVGFVVDRTNDIKALYVPLCLCSILGGALYAAADAIQAIRCPHTILAARLLTGLGTGKGVLVFVMLAQAVPKAEDRNRWVVALSTARSTGLFVGPAVAVVLTGLAGGIENDHGGSWFGAFGLPGLFLCITNTVGMFWLLSMLEKPLPGAPSTPPGGSSPLMGKRVSSPMMRSISLMSEPGKLHMSLIQFFRCTYVLSVCAVMVLSLGTAAAIEYVIPIMCSQVLPWGAKGSGAILMCISIAVVCSQFFVMFLQRSQHPWLRRHLVDVNLVVFGTFGLTAVLGITGALWAALIGIGPGAVAASREHAFLLAVPFVVAEAWMPYMGNGANMLFTRLVLSHVPMHMGICQALVTTNGPIIGQMVLTIWLGATYSGEDIQRQGAPQTAIQGIAAVNLLVALGLLCHYRSLRPPRADEGTPASRMEKLARSISSSDLVVPVNTMVLEEAEQIVEGSFRSGSAVDFRPLLSVSE